MNRSTLVKLGLCVAVPLALAACKKSSAPDDAETALTNPDAEPKPLSAVEQAAAALEKGIKLQEEQRLAAAQAQGPQVDYAALAAAGANAPRPPAEPEAVISEAPVEPDGPEAPAVADAPAAPVETTPAQPTPSRAELSAKLVEVVRQAIREDADPLQAALPLIALGLVEPGVSEPEMRALLDPLSPPEKATVLAVRELLAKIAAGELSSTDPKALAAALAAQRQSLLDNAGVGEGLAPGTIALCSRVESFGQFTPLISHRLLAGRANAALAYTEVRGFIQRPDTRASAEEGFSVDLSQEIALYTDSERPVLQWRIPAQTIRSFSRSQRGDFYLVQRLDFPRTLAAGAYQLRITVRDLNAESGGDSSGDATFETTLPLEVVADPALLKQSSDRTVIRP